MSAASVPAGIGPAGVGPVAPGPGVPPSPWSHRLSMGTVLAFAGIAGVLKIRSVDFFWHLAAGRFMLAHRTLPAFDPFRFTSEAVPWVDHEWGFQLLIAVGETLGGLPALIVARAALFMALGGLIFFGQSRREVPPALAALVALVALVGLRGRLLFRPELATLLGTALLLTLLDRLRQRQDLAALFSLFALAGLWANLHPGVLAAPVLAGVWLFGARFLPGGAPPVPTWQVVAAPTGMAVAILANPWGPELFLVPGRIRAALADLPATNPDWAPIWKSPQPLLFLACGALLVLVALTWWRASRPDGALGLVVLALLPLVASSARHQGLLWIAGAWLAGDCLGRLARPGRPASVGAPSVGAPSVGPAPVGPALMWTGGRATLAVGLVAIAGLAWCLPTTGGNPWRPGHQAGFGVVPGLFPEGAIPEIRRWEPVGPLFNSAPFGGYLLWCLYPPRQIFYDTRNEVAPALLRELAQARSSGAAWEELLRRYRIDGALVRYEERPRPVLTQASEGAAGGQAPGGQAPGGGAPVVEYHTTSALLFPPESFALVWWDDSGMLFLRRTPQRFADLARREYRSIQPEDWRHTLTRAARDRAFRGEVATELRRKLSEDPGCRRAAELLEAVTAMDGADLSSTPFAP